MKRLSVIIFALYSLNAIAQVSFEDAANAARKVPIPAFETFVTHDKKTDVLPPSSIGDTTALSNLRGPLGMGDIKTPGLEKAIRCDTQNDPECLAIQMLKYGSANPPTLGETEGEKIRHQYTETIRESDQILGDLTALGHTERVCQNVSQEVAGNSTTEVCDITMATNDTEATCEEGWDETKSLWVAYACTMQALATDNVCEVKTRALTHEENLFACTDREAMVDEQTCEVPAEVTVKKTFPYTCPIKSAQETKKNCVKTLEVITTPTCNGGAGQDISLRVKTFTDYGWTADPWERSFKAHMSCGTSLTDFTLTIQSSIYNGTITSAPFTTTSTSYGLDFIIAFRVFEKDYMPHWEVSVTNIDAGLGSITLVDSIPFRLINHQERDVWTETCEVIP